VVRDVRWTADCFATQEKYSRDDLEDRQPESGDDREHPCIRLTCEPESREAGDEHCLAHSNSAWSDQREVTNEIRTRVNCDVPSCSASVR